MRFRPALRAIAAGAGPLVGGWLAQVSAHADILVGAPIYPTSSVISTSTYLPTSYVVPTSTYLPTSYLPTSYVVPTSTYLPTSSVVTSGSSVYVPTRSVSSARGGLFRHRRFVEQTSYFAEPTAYVTPTTYYSPTTYLSATSYLSSAIVPTSYLSSSIVPTSYVVPTYSAATILPTTYLARSVVTPTSYLVDEDVVVSPTSTSVCCGDSAASSVPAASVPAPSYSANPTPTRVIAPRPIPSPNSGHVITSQPAPGTGASIRSTERAPSATVNPPADEAPAASVQPEPAKIDAPVPQPALAPANPASPPAAQSAPERPGDLPDIPSPGEMNRNAPQADETINRTSFRPASYGTGMVPSRNVLRGRVVSVDTGQPEESVRVVLASRTGAFRDRDAMTDADGEFKVSLPDGDWDVRVTMPSRSVYTVGRGVTATGGQVLDNAGQTVREFLIKR